MSEIIIYNSTLPDGWQIMNFNDTFKSITLNGIKIKQKNYLASGGIPVVDQGQELIGGYFDDKKYMVQGEPPFIVFGDHTKVKKFVNFNFVAGADGVKVLKPNQNINAKLFFYFLHCIKLPDKGYARHFQFLNDAEFPLPPLPEQHRIVAKIEELFSELDKGIETLKTAKQQLKVYRQAVLKYAFEGRLTNPDVKDGELPEGWVECELKNLSKLINGDRGKNYPNRNEYVTIGIPFINTGHIEPNGKLDKSSMHYITREKFNSLNSGKVKTGDLVYCLRGATMGKTAIIEQFDEGAIASSLVIIRVNEKAINKYIYHFLVSPFGRDLIRLFDNGTAQPNLSANSLSMFSIPLPSVDEQKYIVSEIESRLSVCDKIEESIQQGLLQAEALRQSILKKAFEGKLVPQDPNDEPASVLLERIKAERANEQPEKKRKTKKAKG